MTKAEALKAVRFLCYFMRLSIRERACVLQGPAAVHGTDGRSQSRHYGTQRRQKDHLRLRRVNFRHRHLA